MMNKDKHGNSLERLASIALMFNHVNVAKRIYFS